LTTVSGCGQSQRATGRFPFATLLLEEEKKYCTVYAVQFTL